MMVSQKGYSLKLLIGKILGEKRQKKIQNNFRFNLVYNYIINGPNEIKKIEPRIQCKFIPITLENYYRVNDFREVERISEYKEKLNKNELGFFTEHEGRMIGSVWATINKTDKPFIGKDYTKITPNVGLCHDNVVSEKFRGMRVGPFMAFSLISLLFEDYGLSKVIFDVNVKNRNSFRMHEKVGLRKNHKVLYVAAFGKLLLRIVLKKYS